jgi:hypothetical protein
MLSVLLVVERKEAVNCEGDLSLSAWKPVADKLEPTGVVFNARVCVACLSLDALFFLVGFGRRKGCGGGRLFVPYSSSR